eukprot:Nk52_evm29s156 gene=Nk52_evmTU29s156
MVCETKVGSKIHVEGCVKVLMFRELHGRVARGRGWAGNRSNFHCCHDHKGNPMLLRRRVTVLSKLFKTFRKGIHAKSELFHGQFFVGFACRGRLLVSLRLVHEGVFSCYCWIVKNGALKLHRVFLLGVKAARLFHSRGGVVGLHYTEYENSLCLFVSNSSFRYWYFFPSIFSKKKNFGYVFSDSIPNEKLLLMSMDSRRAHCSFVTVDETLISVRSVINCDEKGPMEEDGMPLGKGKLTCRDFIAQNDETIHIRPSSNCCFEKDFLVIACKAAPEGKKILYIKSCDKESTNLRPRFGAEYGPTPESGQFFSRQLSFKLMCENWGGGDGCDEVRNLCFCYGAELFSSKRASNECLTELPERVSVSGLIVQHLAEIDAKYLHFPTLRSEVINVEMIVGLIYNAMATKEILDNQDKTKLDGRFKDLYKNVNEKCAQRCHKMLMQDKIVLADFNFCVGCLKWMGDDPTSSLFCEIYIHLVISNAYGLPSSNENNNFYFALASSGGGEKDILSSLRLIDKPLYEAKEVHFLEKKSKSVSSPSALSPRYCCTLDPSTNQMLTNSTPHFIDVPFPSLEDGSLTYLHDCFSPFSLAFSEDDKLKLEMAGTALEAHISVP